MKISVVARCRNATVGKGDYSHGFVYRLCRFSRHIDLYAPFAALPVSACQRDFPSDFDHEIFRAVSSHHICHGIASETFGDGAEIECRRGVFFHHMPVGNMAVGDSDNAQGAVD